MRIAEQFHNFLKVFFSACCGQAYNAVFAVIPPPATRAAITDIRAVGGYQIKIWFRDEQTPDSRAVPYGFNGCLLNYAWGAERNDSVSDLKETALMTHLPWTLTLPPEAQKSFLSCAARWQNKKGALGPWGDIQHAVVG